MSEKFESSDSEESEAEGTESEEGSEVSDSEAENETENEQVQFLKVFHFSHWNLYLINNEEILSFFYSLRSV